MADSRKPPERGPGAGPAARAGAHRGNKASLPAKPCVACGRPMSWRKAWARNWDEVKFCSEACRRRRGPA